ncbi:GNAT family N-acetyltransferase [Yinghuangia soli]|uniref:GNAT family N-acetyltransferase n=1 Tax=Yinghuangia soli TaxID=2908204 RepID=A0AA41Q4H9_9ACTN|nr:GNAT family N-acetyltransferase [Yinghuangia soli]MCF2530289.1 GNAT family N-acetyltransferase [Yinghuangia soli]
MTELRIAHTADFEPHELALARKLLDDVFEGDMSDEDWEHCLGGLQALLWEDGELVGHAALVQRRMLLGGRALRCGYVEGVGVRADRRRRGHAGTMMAGLERAVERAYDLGVLSASDEAVPFYLSRGWLPWQGPTSALTPEGLVATPDEDDSVYVFGSGGPADRTAPLAADWRDGDVW